MRRYFFPYIATFFLAVILVACQSQTEQASATPPPFGEPRKFDNMMLAYEDTTKPEYKQLVRRLDSFYRRQVAAGFNGSVLVGYKGKILYERYFGFANREANIKLSPLSASQLASTSKTMTATAILYLYEHNYLDINAKVQEYIPNFPYPNVTVKMLLNHRSGLPDYIKWVPLYRKNTTTPISNDMVLDMFARYKPGLEFKPNTRFTYCNSNYAVLASIIEKVTEMRYPDFMRKYIFEPIGMKNTFVYDPTKGTPVPENTAISYKYNWRREPDMFADGVYGDKGIYSTVQDMYRWDQSFYKHTLLDNETLEMAYGPCSFERPGIKNYGLGWRMLCYPDGEKVIYHNGWWHGNNTVFYRYIKDNFTVVVLGNKYNGSIYRQQPVIYNIINSAAANKATDVED